MPVSAPKVDSRTAAEIAARVKTLLAVYAPDWREFDPVTGQPDNVSAALIGIFSRFSELIIERLNKVPNKNFLAYLDLLGASLLPPAPARAPLTFALAAGTTTDAIVPAATQVAAAPAEGEKTPVIFETERELVVTSAQLASIFCKSPEQDAYADLGSINSAGLPNGLPVFLGTTRIEHAFYVGHGRLFSYPGLKEVRVKITTAGTIDDPDSLATQWEAWNGERWAPPRIPANGGPLEQIVRSGPSRVAAGSDVIFSNLSPLPGTRSLDVGLERRNTETEMSWLRCRLLTPITPADERRTGMVRASRLPQIAAISLQATAGKARLAVDTALCNSTPVDVSKEYFPFGEKPKFGDTLYLAVDEAFSERDSAVTLHVNLTNPAGGAASPIPAAKADPGTTVTWEFWDGSSWSVLGAAKANEDATSPLFSDTTRAFTKNGDVKFTIPGQPAVTAVNGVEKFWVRARLTSGNYGREAGFKLKDEARPELGYLPINPDKLEFGYQLAPATYAPPSISSLTVDYAFTKTGSPESVLSYNDFTLEEQKNPRFAPFKPASGSTPSVYLGFTLPPGRARFPNRKISVYAGLDGFKYGEKVVPLSPTRGRKPGDPGDTVVHEFLLTNPLAKVVTCELRSTGAQWTATINVLKRPSGGSMNPAQFQLDPSESVDVRVGVSIPADSTAGERDRGFLSLTVKADHAASYAAAFETTAGAGAVAETPRVVWEYSAANGWPALPVRDDSEGFARPGLFEFLGPSDMAAREEFGLSRHWIRAVWTSGDYEYDPRLHRMTLNTMMASASVLIRNEVLGSSDGGASQKFRTTRAPVLDGQQLEVRERENPSASEQKKLVEEQGRVSVITAAADQTREIWVRWTEVPDFYGSGSRDRHYVIDHLTGDVLFGDGINGLSPPPGAGNIRMTQYKTGGGVAGNKAAGAITLLKTTVPYVEKVTNFEAAAGGAEAEAYSSLLDRAPRTIRHQGRAVTVEDYEDLAMLASPEVARARCVPLFDLISDPEAARSKPGLVSLIIVPRSIEPKPLAGVELMNRVERFIGTRKIPSAQLVVAGPEYLRVDVDVDAALTSMEGSSEVELAIRQALARFLHPLTGGLDGTGWDFGRQPHKSDLYVLIEGVPGVDHVRVLTVTRTNDRTGVVIETKEGEPGSEMGRFLVYSGTHTITLSFEEA